MDDILLETNELLLGERLFGYRWPLLDVQTKGDVILMDCEIKDIIMMDSDVVYIKCTKDKEIENILNPASIELINVTFIRVCQCNQDAPPQSTSTRRAPLLIDSTSLCHVILDSCSFISVGIMKDTDYVAIGVATSTSTLPGLDWASSAGIDLIVNQITA
ncbi:MAG: hypothetical protein EZS28_055190, partial [Streblomastix strix]